MKYSGILTITLFLAIFAINGCSNTVEGAGSDIESAGKWVKDTF